jgi:hypothetical protein
MDAFKAIPDQFAVSLFNTIAKAAFPGFDNLVMAAWNVVCVYEFVGTEFPGFHNAIVELKSVLQEFDATYRKERSVTRNEQKNRQGHKGTKTESPAETANSVPTRYGQQITNIHDRLQEQHGPTMESDTMKFSTTSTPMQAPDRPDAMTMDGNRSPKPVRDYQSIPAVRPPGEKKSSENFDPPKEPKASQNAQKQHTQPTGRTREMTAEEMKKQDLVTQLKDRQRQLHELKTGHKQTTALEQWSDNHHSNKNNNDCNERPIERSHYEGNNSKPTPIGPKPTKKVRPFQEVDSKDEEVKIPHGSEAGVQSQQPTISLGQSKLGRPKAGALGNGSAPEAPMIHNGKREQNGNGRSS